MDQGNFDNIYPIPTAFNLQEFFNAFEAPPAIRPEDERGVDEWGLLIDDLGIQEPQGYNMAVRTSGALRL